MMNSHLCEHGEYRHQCIECKAHHQWLAKFDAENKVILLGREITALKAQLSQKDQIIQMARDEYQEMREDRKEQRRGPWEDKDENPCTLLEKCTAEPEWAEDQLTIGNDWISDLQDKVERLEGQNKVLKADVESVCKQRDILLGRTKD